VALDGSLLPPEAAAAVAAVIVRPNAEPVNPMASIAAERILKAVTDFMRLEKAGS
jgi:hypothetical protein